MFESHKITFDKLEIDQGRTTNLKARNCLSYISLNMLKVVFTMNNEKYIYSSLKPQKKWKIILKD